MSTSGAHRRARRTSLVLLQLLVFASYIFGPTAAFADEPTPEPTPTESVASDPSTEPTPEPTPASSEPDPTPAPDPTSAPEPTPAPSDPTPTDSAAPAPIGSPTISSDKDDYAPGELVTLTGANWVPGEVVHIRVNDDAGETWRRDVDVIADLEGRITDQFNLPDWFVAQYFVTASGPLSGSRRRTSPMATSRSAPTADCTSTTT